MNFTQDSFEEFQPHIIDKNKEMLDKGFYAIGNWNDRYIPGTRAYQKYDFMHPCVLWGYDDEKGIFKAAGYLENRHYQAFDVKYEDYYQSIQNSIFKYFSLEYYKVNTDFSGKVDINRLIENLNDYLLSRKSEGDTLEEGIWGIHVWEILCLHIRHLQDVLKREELLLRDIRLYMEHKGIMYKRILYLCEHGYIIDYSLSSQYLENIYERSKLVFNLSIKYNISKKTELLDHIADIVKDINKKEVYYIEKLIEELKKYETIYLG